MFKKMWLIASVASVAWAVSPASALFIHKTLKNVSTTAKNAASSVKKAVTPGAANRPVPSRTHCAAGLTPGQPPIAALNPRAKLDVRQQRLLQFAPIVYLHNEEKYLPARVEDFFTSKSTKVAKGNQVVIPAGKTTMAALHAQYAAGAASRSLTIVNDECAKSGSDPATNSRGGALSTPVYGIYLTKGGVDYIKYFFFYGYNGYYPLKVLGIQLKDNVGGQHWGDIERITLRLDRTKTRIDEVFYAAHGGGDGQMIPRAQLELEGSRPVVYSALNGHGSYPRAGLYVRVGGFGNDVTMRGIRWAPEVVQVFAQPKAAGNPFDPNTMGWIYAPANLGDDGVASLAANDWFTNPREKPAFGPLQNWCADPNDRICMIQKAGARAVWQPILDEISGVVGAKVIAPIRAAYEQARDAVKAGAGKATKAVSAAATRAASTIQGAAKTVGDKLKGAGSKVAKSFKKLKFW